MGLLRKFFGGKQEKEHNPIEALIEQGKYDEAIAITIEGCEQIRHLRGENDPSYAKGLKFLAELYIKAEKYTEAEELLWQVLYRHLHVGRDDPSESDSDERFGILTSLVDLYRTTGKSASDLPAVWQVLEVAKRRLGEGHPDIEEIEQMLMVWYRAIGDHSVAEPLTRLWVEDTGKALGTEHPRYAVSLTILADLYITMSRYNEAAALYRRAGDIERKVSGEESRRYVDILHKLAYLSALQGDYATAQELYRRTSQTLEKVLGPYHPDLATSLYNWAALYSATGNYMEAEIQSRRALSIRRRALGEEHPDVATAMNGLARVYRQAREYVEAEPLFLRALEIRRKVLGEEHPDVAESMHTLAILYFEMQRFTEAEGLARRALKIRESDPRGEARVIADTLVTLANLHHVSGNYVEAEPLFRRALEIRRSTLGDEHHLVVESIIHLATLCAAIGREVEAWALMQEAASIYDRILGQVFSFATESARVTYVTSLQRHLDLFMSLLNQHFADDQARISAGLDLVLRRKAIGLEALITQRESVLRGRYPGLAHSLQELQELTSQIGEKTLEGPIAGDFAQYLRSLEELQERKEFLEAELARQIPEMNLASELQTVNCKTVAQALPEGAVMVEFVRFDCIDFKAVPAAGDTPWKPARYLAFVLPAGEPHKVRMVDLGESQLIDELILGYRRAIVARTESRSVRDQVAYQGAGAERLDLSAGLALRAAVFDPLLASLNNRTPVVLCPDGDLARLPFEVLPTGEASYLIDNYHISYLTVGRDALGLGDAVAPQPSPPIVVASPDFDLGKSEPAQPLETAGLPGRHSRDLAPGTLHFGELPATYEEGVQIANLLGVQPLLGDAALEGRLKACKSPHMLHLATHGFFLADQEGRPGAEVFHAPGSEGFNYPAHTSLNTRLEDLENPMLRSGLALAGANTWLMGGKLPDEAEDGLLTAEDVSTMDLLDTELVVLSACDTGLGEVRIGEGVLGLRRAFVLAGTKTLVMSLWKVPDVPTQELMIDFYRHIVTGVGRSKSLRDAQLKLRSRYPHPRYWGAFICQGDPSPLRYRPHG